MSRYSPTVLPDDSPSPFQQTFLEELRAGPERLRQRRADERAAAEDEYRRKRRETLDPLEDALFRAQLYGQGGVPAGAALGGRERGLADMLEQPDRGADLLSGRAHFGDQGLGDQGVGRAPQFRRERVGQHSPGAFNPLTGDFNAAVPRTDTVRGGGARIPLGGGYELDPSLTDRGRTAARQRQTIEALVARGVPRDEAEAEVLGNMEGAISEHFHPGPYQPRTKEEALELIQARADAEARAARGRVGDVRLRDELTRVERQVDDTRADLAAAEREKPDLSQYLMAGKTVEDHRRALADRDRRVTDLRQRADSLSGVRDALAARLQGGPAGAGGGGSVEQQRAAWDRAAREITANPSKYGGRRPEQVIGPRP